MQERLHEDFQLQKSFHQLVPIFMKGTIMVWDLETMEQNNREATYNYVERNKDIIDSAVTQVLSIVLNQITNTLKTVNLETADVIRTIREEVRKELQEIVIEEKLGMKENDK